MPRIILDSASVWKADFWLDAENSATAFQIKTLSLSTCCEHPRITGAEVPADWIVILTGGFRIFRRTVELLDLF